MKKIIASLVAVAALSVAGAASAASPITAVENTVGAAVSTVEATAASVTKGYYAQVNVGSQFESNRDSGTNFSLAYGRQVGNFRGEVEYLGTRDVKSAKLGNVSTNLANINAYYQPNYTFKGLQPFVGAGVGYGELQGASNRNAVVYNATAGLSYKLTSKIDLVTEYRYFISTDTSVRGNDLNDNKYRASAAVVGVRYSF